MGIDAFTATVQKRARMGVYNRRVAREVERGNRSYLRDSLKVEFGEFLCTCGRDDCDQVLVVPLEEHRFVREARYRFLVAHGHATELDDFLRRADEYDVIEVKPEYRHTLQRVDGL